MITRWALRNDRVTLLGVAAIFVAGILAYLSLPQSEDPGFVVRTAVVNTWFPGASPERMEELVTSVIEARVQEIPEIEVVYSTSITGQSTVFVDVAERYADMRPIWDDLRRKIEAVADDLPEDVIGPIVDDELDDVFGVVLALVAEGYTDAEMVDIAEDLRDRLIRLDEAAKVELQGAQPRRITLEFDQAKLTDLHLSPMQLQGLLQQQNIVTPGGLVVDGPERLVLEPSGSWESLDDLRKTVIALPGGRELLFLGDLARVVDGPVDPPEPRVHYLGERALAVAVSMRDGGNVGRLGRQVDEVLEAFAQEHPIGVEVYRVNDQPALVRSDIRNFLSNLGQAVLIVMLAMMPFLGVRTGLIVASLIPLAMLATFVLMAMLGVGLDTISLAAMIIALGMLVDNGIVVTESTLVGMREGMSATEAAVAAAEELQVPLLVSSLTTAAAFLPIFLSQSMTGEYTSPLFVVVTMALMSSWVLSITAVPLFCVHFLAVSDDRAPDPRVERWVVAYRGLLRDVLRRPWATIGAATAALGVAAWLGVYVVDFAFFPPSDKASFVAEIELAPGATLDETDRVVSEIERWVDAELRVGDDRREGVTSWAAFVGSSAPRFELSYVPRIPADNYAYIKLETTSRDIVDELAPRLERHLHETHPDVLADVHPLTVGPPTGKPVAVRISADDEGALMERAAQVEAHLRDVPGAQNVGNDWGARAKKLEVRVDPIRARMAGISNADIAVSLQATLSGIELTEYRDGDEPIPVVLRAGAADRTDLGRIESLTVFVQSTGAPVPLKQVADVALVFEAPKILRRELQKTVEVHADVAPGANAARISSALQRWMRAEAATWGPGVRWSVGGEAQVVAASTDAIFAQMPVAALVITVLLVLQFNAIRRVVINLVVLPFGLIGVTFGLLVTDLYFGFMTLLGTVSLFGIVLNNANILLDRIEIEERVLGRSPLDAILEASTRRLRPILLTTGTTVGGLLPLYFGGGPVFEPMAVALLSGLVFGTLLSLVLVPAMVAVAYGVQVPAEMAPASPPPAPVRDGLAPMPLAALAAATGGAASSPQDETVVKAAAARADQEETVVHADAAAILEDETNWVEDE
jgi:multidrug efflux pump